MALPVIANVFRCTLNWAGNGGTYHNVFHVSCPSGNEQDVAAALDANTSIDMWEPLHASMSLQSYTVLPLDGTSAAFELPATSGNNGGAGGDMIPNTAFVLSFATGVRGPSGRGRLYLGPTGETTCSGGIYSGSVDDVNTGWATFAANLNSGTPSIALGVASYTNGTFNAVSNIIGRAELGTQRRRQNR